MTTRERGQVFGELAEEYDRVRPGYPAELVTDVLGLAGPGPVLEVGAGTGKATALFAARDVDLTCLEPDPRMAAVLRRVVPGVPVIESTFEGWTPDRSYGLVISAQAWHWVDRDRRDALAFQALAPGGLLAPFWNVFLVPDRELHTALAQVDARHGLAGDDSPHSLRPDDVPDVPRPFAEQWPQLAGIEDLFTDLRTLRYRSVRSYTPAEYRAHLHSISLYRMLDEPRREAVIDDTIAVVEAHGDTIDFAVHTFVALARRPS
ncbi:class I SAM-dependent methyltransferase [Actinoplanes sichuanensis]|uniref:Class I SAM-dependent methyltransferase n=1 Tax=Actinoplanes sichuanensis TaxID=512349 RepID=A0ABW4A7V2_9ACTN|nr:class I SAM-dependent methyltransferase [Actinoplanes sichuanensis]BEL09402.1 class I SAM-dependent methyltransferase [Actinoplanes sichuanensis]